MALRKIHCDYYELAGPDWTSVSKEQATSAVRLIENMSLLGQEKNLYGFVGTTSIENVIGGFFAIQYEAELKHYDTQKRLTIETDFPFERVFFILFAETGKLVLQNRTFTNLPLSMYMVSERFKAALTRALQDSRIGFILSFNTPKTQINSPEVFQQEFQRSEKVSRLIVESPDPEKIPEGFVYYNPHYERNKIVRDSHKHDYENFERIDMEAKPEIGNLKSTHLAKDLIQVATPTLMKYRIGGEDYTLKETVPVKFEIHVDMDAPRLDQENLQSILFALRAEIGLPFNIPTRSSATSEQMALFGSIAIEENEEGDE